VEALVRWNHPELGLMPPIRFIPLAEDTGFINQLGKWVLREACRQMVRWQEAGLHVPKIAVNLSVKQFERAASSTWWPIRCTRRGWNRAPAAGGDGIGDHEYRRCHGLHQRPACHRRGLAIDDFGTGYSSLAYLKQLPVQTLKIDRSFIKDISTDVNDEAIAIAIIQLGKSMNLSVIAEGVETIQQAEFLVRHGCHLAQGYLYSRPLDADDMLTHWKNKNGDSLMQQEQQAPQPVPVRSSRRRFILAAQRRWGHWWWAGACCRRASA
jgi:EAL domain-containing protein (putative c-di-GMP-specific phosphodiesterase class I)